MLVRTGELKNKKYVVVGAARSGAAAAEFLVRNGANVTITDIKSENAIPEIANRLKGLGVRLDLGGHNYDLLQEADCIVLSPGVPAGSELIKKAIDTGKYVISEIELGYQHTDATIIGITGSNGKTTTTAMTGAILKHAGFNPVVCGNIGNSFVSELMKNPNTECFVIELSSFQLETIDKFKPKSGAILNITPDHLDRYKSVEEYASAKYRLFLNQDNNDYAILNFDDVTLKSQSKKLISKTLFFSMKEKIGNGLYLAGKDILLVSSEKEEYFCPSDILILKGSHNIENFLAAALLALSVGANKDHILKSASEFKPVEHRLEFVAEINGVSYYNDSKATNVDATIKALESFGGKIILILGGRDKGSDFTVLRNLIKEKVQYLIITGEASQKIKSQLGECVPHIIEEKFSDAVTTAIQMAEKGNIVLLAPACASFDQFKNYEERGRIFKDIVLSYNGIKERNG